MQKPRALALSRLSASFRVGRAWPAPLFMKTVHFVLSRLTSKSSANKLPLFPRARVLCSFRHLCRTQHFCAIRRSCHQARYRCTSQENRPKPSDKGVKELKRLLTRWNKLNLIETTSALFVDNKISRDICDIRGIRSGYHYH